MLNRSRTLDRGGLPRYIFAQNTPQLWNYVANEQTERGRARAPQPTHVALTNAPPNKPFPPATTGAQLYDMWFESTKNIQPTPPALNRPSN